MKLCKDIIFYISNMLDSRDLLNFSILSKYYYRLLDNNYFKNLYWSKYGKILLKDGSVKTELLKPLSEQNLLENINKATRNYKAEYFTIEKYLQIDVGKGLDFCLDTDHVKLLILLDHFKQIYHITQYCYLAVKKNSLNCYIYLKNKANFEGNVRDVEYNYHAITAIINKSDSIIEYCFNNNIAILETGKLFFCFRNYSKKYIELYLKKHKSFSNEIIDDTISTMVHSEIEVKKWSEIYNEAFSLFAKSLSLEKVNQIRDNALKLNRHYIIKVITVYTSPFSHFY